MMTVVVGDGDDDYGDGGDGDDGGDDDDAADDDDGDDDDGDFDDDDDADDDDADDGDGDDDDDDDDGDDDDARSWFKVGSKLAQSWLNTTLSKIMIDLCTKAWHNSKQNHDIFMHQGLAQL